VYFILGIDEEGYREVLDFYIGTTESSYVWEEILYSLKERGATDVLLSVMDGLPGLEEAFNKVYPKADVQSCVVHKVRNTIRKVRKKDLSEILQDLKSVYESPTKDQAMIMLDEFSTKWGSSTQKLLILGTIIAVYSLITVTLLLLEKLFILPIGLKGSTKKLVGLLRLKIRFLPKILLVKLFISK